MKAETFEQLRELFFDCKNEEELSTYLQLMKHDMIKEAADYMLKVVKSYK